jgi:hypothetical protein
MGIKCRGRVEDLAVKGPPRGDDSERFMDVRRGSCLLFSAPFDSGFARRLISISIRRQIIAIFSAYFAADGRRF